MVAASSCWLGVGWNSMPIKHEGKDFRSVIAPGRAPKEER